MQQSDRLKGKTALITAGAQGIGRATALAMAAAGAQVFATDVNDALLQELTQTGFDNLSVFHLDVLDDASVKAGIDKVRPDILFNCAGFVHAGTMLESTDDEWEFGMDLNVRSIYRTTRAALPYMIEKGTGSIINMSSVVSTVKGVPNRFIYGVTKSAVIGFTKSVAIDYVTTGVRCNCICPGTVESPSWHDRVRASGDYEKAKADFIARQPMGRIGRPEEIAMLAVYLASDESAVITGQEHIIDGGWAI